MFDEEEINEDFETLNKIRSFSPELFAKNVTEIERF